MYSSVKELPLIINLRRKLFEYKFSTHENVNYFRGIFKDFKEAMESSPSTKPIGYNNKRAAKLYKERMDKIHSTDYPVLFWMNKLSSEIETVFDFGGHVGIHYFSYSKVINRIETLKKWTVCDVPSVVDEGKKYALARKSLNLNFVNELSACENYDLFLASGSLQYLEWELHDQIKALNVPPKIVIINMTPLHPMFKSITLQSIGASFCPYLIRREVDFVKGMQNIGYEILDQWNNEEKKCNIAFEYERSLTFYRGMVFKLREQ